MESRLHSIVARLRGDTRSAPSRAIDPCRSCGDETAIGSVFYSDRRAVEDRDGGSTYLCDPCNARIRSVHGGRRMTDEEVRSLVENGSMAGIVWGGGGGMGGS